MRLLGNSAPTPGPKSEHYITQSRRHSINAALLWALRTQSPVLLRVLLPRSRLKLGDVGRRGAGRERGGGGPAGRRPAGRSAGPGKPASRGPLRARQPADQSPGAPPGRSAGRGRAHGRQRAAPAPSPGPSPSSRPWWRPQNPRPPRPRYRRRPAGLLRPPHRLPRPRLRCSRWRRPPCLRRSPPGCSVPSSFSCPSWRRSYPGSAPPSRPWPRLPQPGWVGLGAARGAPTSGSRPALHSGSRARRRLSPVGSPRRVRRSGRLPPRPGGRWYGPPGGSRAAAAAAGARRGCRGFHDHGAGSRPLRSRRGKGTRGPEAPARVLD